MIIFAVTTNVEYVSKPEWLDNFFKKHNKVSYDFHVTLKQPCIIDEAQIVEIKNILKVYFEKNNPKKIEIVFDKLNSDTSEEELSRNDASIMVDSDNQEIKMLQKYIVGTISAYKNYFDEGTRNYEENFMPHITIATNLNQEEFESAKNDVGVDLVIKAKLTKVILTVVYDYKETTEKRENTVWSLS
jgi:2'-5' RNA ligase